MFRGLVCFVDGWEQKQNLVILLFWYIGNIKSNQPTSFNCNSNNDRQYTVALYLITVFLYRIIYLRYRGYENNRSCWNALLYLLYFVCFHLLILDWLSTYNLKKPTQSVFFLLLLPMFSNWPPIYNSKKLSLAEIVASRVAFATIADLTISYYLWKQSSSHQHETSEHIIAEDKV